METITIGYPKKEERTTYKPAKRKWQRVTLLTVLGYEAAGSLFGGSLLVAAPDGRLMKMPVDIMHGAFPDFLIRGIILFALGGLNAAAFIAVLRRTRLDWFMAYLALGGKQFHYYSIATFAVLLFVGVLTFLNAPGIARNEPTPLIGIWERINIGVLLLWVVVLAIILLKKQRGIGLTKA